MALELTSQLLKSLNACVLRTGGAALGTVTVLVDDVLRPALARAGVDPAAVGVVRSTDHSAAEALVSVPELIPLVILRGSGRSTAELTRVAADHGVRVWPTRKAEGSSTSTAPPTPVTPRDSSRRASTASVSATGSTCCWCTRRSSSTRARGRSSRERRAARDRACVPRGGPGAARRPAPARVGERPRARRDGHRRCRRLRRRGGAAREHRDVRPRGAIVTEDSAAADEFLDGYRGTAAYWNAPTRFTDGFALTGAPETGINVDWAPGPRGPVTYRDLWLRQFRVVGDGTQHR